MIGLMCRYHKNKGYCWDKDDSGDVCKEPASEPSILDTTDKGSWKQGWYCFWVSKAEEKLKGQKCSNNQKSYICEEGMCELLNSLSYDWPFLPNIGNVKNHYN